MKQCDQEMTTTEAGDLLKLGVSEIRTLCRTGVLICTKRAGRWYLSRSAVAKYLADRLHDLGQPQ